jgi:hypothetical protein
MTLTDLKNLVKDKVVKIKFTKLDGTPREMICTTDFSIIKSQEKNFVPPKKNRKIPKEIVTVWDFEKHGWRTIIPENVTEHDVVLLSEEEK